MMLLCKYLEAIFCILSTLNYSYNKQINYCNLYWWHGNRWIYLNGGEYFNPIIGTDFRILITIYGSNSEYTIVLSGPCIEFFDKAFTEAILNKKNDTIELVVMNDWDIVGVLSDFL